MVDGLNRQTFVTYDPRALKPLGEKLRVFVHGEGDWHMAVTAFIIAGETIEDAKILVQERSQYVDIAQKHFDQSLATQLLVEDQGDTEIALYRGLRDELGITPDDVSFIFKWNNLGDIYISKSYSDNPELWNREIVTNYFVRVKNPKNLSPNFKVQGFEWIPWSEFCDLVRMQPNNFTKSVRIYTVADAISDDINNVINSIISNNKLEMLKKNIYYLSLDTIDFVGIEQKNESVVELYKTSYTMRKVRDKQKYALSDIKEALFVNKREENKLVVSL